MTVYSWGHQSPIAKMEVLPFGKAQEAILHARADADPAQLGAMRQMFRSQGIAVVPDEVEGQPVLRLRGFESEAFLAAAIEQNGFAPADQRQSAPSEKKPKEKGGFVSKIREKSFVTSGYVYMIGDAALAVSGLKRGDVNETFSGLAYGATSVVAAGYGARKPDRVFNELYSKMLGEFAKEGVELPEGTELTAKELGKPGGLINRIENFLYNYPTQILTAGNAIAGFQLFRAGVNQGNTDKRMAGALVATGMLTALLVPEKSSKKAVDTVEGIAERAEGATSSKEIWVQPELEKPKGVKGMLISARDWVQEKPLRVGGYMAMGNNFFMAKGALAERQSNPLQREYLTQLKNGHPEVVEGLKDPLKKKIAKKDFAELTMLKPDVEVDRRTIDDKLERLEKADGMWMANMTAAASYMVANGLLSISSTKGSNGSGKDKDGKEKKDPNSELYAAAAAIIANQPEAVQEATINKMSVFLASQREIDMPPEELATKMREKVAAVKDNPWLDPAKHPTRAPQPAQPPRFADSVSRSTPAAAAWAEKEAAREGAAAKDSGIGGAAR